MKSFLKKITPDFLLSWYHFILAFLGAIIYRFPAKKLEVIGITGTNGKSTVVFLISQILEAFRQAQGKKIKVAAISSIQFKIKNKVWPNPLKMTMPGRLKLQKFLHQAVKAGCQYAVLEVTSEGIKQHRHKFIGFDSAVFTNLTPEHLESHGDFDNYKTAKGKLFQSLRPGGKIIVNLDDPTANYFLQFPAKEKIGYAIDAPSSVKVHQLIKPKNYQLTPKGVSFLIDHSNFNLNLLGKFNIYNALAAITIGLAEGVSLKEISLALGKIKGIPGRLEIVIKKPFTVIVDYAHTPDALEKVYQTIKEVFPGRMIGVIGAAGGGRDRWKRPELGKIADQYCDQIIITNEDPYDENPQTIIDEIAKGIRQKKPEKILDRQQAIHRALELAQTAEVVIITGKGCESWMCLARGEKIPWDDRKIVREEFAKL